MKWLAKTILLATIGSTLPCIPILAVDPPSQTHQPGFWQPVARIDLKQTTQIKLINESPFNIDYQLSDSTATKKTLPSGQTVPIAQVPIPAYFLINPSSSAPTRSRINLEVSVDAQNQIIVKIRETQGSSQQNSTLNINETGAIYVY